MGKESNYSQTISVESDQLHYLNELKPFTATYLATGADSSVYLLESPHKERTIAKVYDPSLLTVSHIKRYKELTNSLNEHLQETPYKRCISLGNASWDVQVVVTPVEDVQELPDGSAISFSPFVAGRNLNEYVSTLRNTVRRESEDKDQNDSIDPLSYVGESSYSLPRDLFLEFYNNHYKMSIKDGIENSFNGYMNHYLQTKYIRIQPVNIKPQIVSKSHLILVITDIEGVLHDTKDIIGY